MTTATRHQIPVLFDNASAVPYGLGDVVLFVSRDVGGADSAILNTVDPFTGADRDHGGSASRAVVDHPRHRGHRDAVGWHALGFLPVRDRTAYAMTRHSGNYLQIDTGNATTTNTGDDGIETWQANECCATGDVRHDVGYQFNALTFANPDVFGVNSLFAVGNRIPGNLNQYSRERALHVQCPDGCRGQRSRH